MEVIYDVTVAYRIYPKVSKVPPIHRDDKLKLSEVCLNSFVGSFGQLKVKFIALLDSCPSEYRALFEKVIPRDCLTIIDLVNAGNAKTFQKQIELLLEQEDSELIYFAEDDYFYLPNGLEQMVRFMNSYPDVHFVTPYDHLDYYTSPINVHQTSIRVSNGKHWRIAATTCLTFLTSKTVISKTSTVFATYHEKGNLDFAVWLALTKFHVRNLTSVFRFFLLWLKDEKMPWWSTRHAWKHSTLEIAFGKRWLLWAPLPSCATHMESKFLAPNIDWYAHFKSAQK